MTALRLLTGLRRPRTPTPPGRVVSLYTDLAGDNFVVVRLRSGNVVTLLRELVRRSAAFAGDNAVIRSAVRTKKLSVAPLFEALSVDAEPQTA
jgi:hypothetical protein